MSAKTYMNRGPSAAIKRLYLDETTADIRFIFPLSDGQCELVPAHKLLLSANSDVFGAMFNGSWREAEDRCIISDATSADFREFLQFFYYDTIEITAENINVFVRLGQKYLVEECSNACAQFLTDNLSNANVCSSYRFSLAVGHQDLKRLCEVKICIDATDVFATDDFLECDRPTIVKILQLDSLSCSEVDVFVAAMEWVKAASKSTDLGRETVLEHLGDDLFTVRFGAMTPDELNDIFSSHANIFTPELRSDVCGRIQSDDTEMVKRPREVVWNRADVIKCLRKIEDRSDEHPYQIQTNESTTFVTNRLLLLRAVVCGEMMQFLNFKSLAPLEEEIHAELTIYEYSGAFEITNRAEYIVYYEMVTMTEFLTLTKPIIIKPGFNYKISLDIALRYTCCTDYFVDCKDVEFHVQQITVKFTEDEIKLRNHGGLINGLHFNEI